MSNTIRELQIWCPKLGEIPLQPQLDYPGWPVEVGLERSASGHFIKKMIKINEDEGACGHIIEVMESFHQGDPFDLYPFGFVGENVLVEPV